MFYYILNKVFCQILSVFKALPLIPSLPLFISVTLFASQRSCCTLPSSFLREVVKEQPKHSKAKSRCTPTTTTVPLAPENKQPQAILHNVVLYEQPILSGINPWPYQSCHISTLCTRASPNSRTPTHATHPSNTPSALSMVQGILF